MIRTAPSRIGRFSSIGSIGFSLIAVALPACEGGDPSAGNDDDLAAVMLALTSVPSDVQCVEVSVKGVVRTVSKRFSVAPASSAALSFPGLPLGPVTIDEQAFNVACSSVTATTAPTWTAAAPVSVTLSPGVVSPVTIILKRPGQVSVTTDFQSGTGVTPSVGAFDGFLLQAPCGDGGTGFDCIDTGCTSGSRDFQQSFTLTGTPGTIYDVAFRVRGVVEAKNYVGGARRQGTSMTYTTAGGDFWYEGGSVPMSTYNSYELAVTPAVAGAPNVYFLNARNGTGENHETWVLDYNATIKVPAGGTIRFRNFDSNCRLMENCGPGVGSSATGCRAPTSLSLSGAQPAPPASFVQPFLGNTSNAPGQWLFIDVLSITAN